MFNVIESLKDIKILKDTTEVIQMHIFIEH